ncbi:MAG: outer membrane lipoprotein carrier protein LolA [Phycisphaerales bacterium]|nr:outer membrane lipoprotein carrier protein LolA [Phycisphaerales bacterium]
MIKQVFLATTATVVMVSCASPVWAGEDLAAVEKKIGEAFAKVKSAKAKLTLTQDMKMGEMSMQGKGNGTIEFVRDGDKLKSRMELKNAQNMKMGESENKSESEVLQITDGQFNWVLSSSAGQKQAMKTKADSNSSADPSTMLGQMKKDSDVVLAADETIDGRKVWVLEATPKQPNPMISKNRVYFCQETGMLVRLESLDKDNKAINTMSFSDLEVNPTIAADRFVFTAPEGVTVQDMTGASPAMPTGGEVEKAKDDAKKAVDDLKDKLPKDAPKMPEMPK